ncbi:hypothetical protein C8J57DRAFT_1728217 [Mycena rebaudengoi]|nr:hypothetical protein C8J57DRAFT_1728217 [Mycena rebaudengoi]
MSMNRVPQDVVDDIALPTGAASQAGTDTRKLQQADNTAHFSPHVSAHRFLYSGLDNLDPWLGGVATRIRAGMRSSWNWQMLWEQFSCGPRSRLHIIGLHDIPPALIVDTLLIHRSTASTADAPTQISNPTLPHLILPVSVQKIDLVCDVLLRSPAYIANLERLWIGIDPVGSMSDTRLLSAVAPTLMHLEIGPEGFDDPVDLPLMPHVVTLTLHLQIRRDTPFFESFSSWRAPVKLARTFPRLEALFLNVSIHLRPNDYDTGWPSRDSPVHEHAEFVHLRHVACTVFPTGGADVVLQKFRTALENLMPVLRCTRDMLSCHFTDIALIRTPLALP